MKENTSKATDKPQLQLTFGKTAIAAAASVGSRHITNDFVGLRRTVCRRSNARYQENEREKHAFARWVFNKKPKYGQFKKLESGNPVTGKRREGRYQKKYKGGRA